MGDDFTTADKNDIDLYKNPHSSYMYFEDLERLVIINIFKSTNFEYSQFSGKPMKFDYNELKDNIEWKGLELSAYVPLLKSMANQYIKYLPS